jgi:ATP-dependent 26S proteasome regulatory subunit
MLVLEDTGELLSIDAKERAGQGLSRLLNAVDGLLGQGSRVLLLITTNEELGALHPAVTRPGRCASQVEFFPLSPVEAKALR